MKRLATAVAALLLALHGVQAQLPQLVPLRDMKGDLHPMFKNGKWGYANDRNKFVINPVFDGAERFNRVGASDGSVLDVAKVRIGSNWGYVSREGIFFISPQYGFMSDFDIHSVAFASNGGSYIMYGVEPYYSVNLGAKIVKATVLDSGFDEIPQFSFKGIAIAKKSGKYGILRSSGKWTVPCDNDRISQDQEFKMYRLERDGLIGYANYNGDIVFPVQFASLGWFSPGVVIAKNGGVGLFRQDGSAIIPVEFDSIDRFGSNLILRKGGKAGLATMDGKMIIPVEYEEIGQMPDGNFMVKGADGYNVYGPDCTPLVRSSFDSLVLDPKLGYLVEKDGLHGRLDAHGKYMYPCIFEEVPDPELKGYVEMMVDGEPYIFLAGESSPRKVSDYDDYLYRTMSDRSYAASTILPAWMKGHMGRGRIENKPVLSDEAVDWNGLVDDAPLVCYTFHRWAGVVEAAVCPSGGREYSVVTPGARVSLELEYEYPKLDPEDYDPEDFDDRDDYIRYVRSGSFNTYEMLVHEPSENGIALYEVLSTRHYWKYNRGAAREVRTDSPVTAAYGFIGLGCEYFVQPLFGEAYGFDLNGARVRIGDEWKLLTAEQISAYDPYVQPL